ncbi:MAG TPA: hypothetical protein VD995_14280 [Azospirillum sp.]|nr:hypothetical protein [Azospirillum sp.]
MHAEMVHGADPRPIRRIAAVEAATGRMLIVTWDHGGTDEVDLSGWIGFHDIAELRDESVFRRPEIAEYGSAVQWAGNEDLAIDSVHLELLAEQQRPFGSTDLTAWQERLGLSNQEAADLLDVALSTFHTYKSGTARIPSVVQIACRAIERDPLLFEAHYRPRRPSGRPPKAA